MIWVMDSAMKVWNWEGVRLLVLVFVFGLMLELGVVAPRLVSASNCFRIHRIVSDSITVDEQHVEMSLMMGDVESITRGGWKRRECGVGDDDDDNFDSHRPRYDGNIVSVI